MEKEVSKVTLPTVTGEITILPNHVPYVTEISPGVIEIGNGEAETENMAISGGFLEFHGNEAVILADTAERAEEIDLERAEEARKRAEEMKQEARKNKDETQYATVVTQIEKQLARIRTAKRYSLHSSRRTTMRK